MARVERSTPLTVGPNLRYDAAMNEEQKDRRSPLPGAIGYVRVSTNGQGNGHGPEIQRQAIEEWAAAHGVPLLEVASDTGVSGAVLQRPGLERALNALRPGDTLVVYRLDRLARDLVTQELLLREIRRQGAALASCSPAEQAYLEDDAQDPARKLIRQVLGAVAEFEREMIRLRLQRGRRAKRAAGGYVGGEAPFGWRVAPAGGLERDDREQMVLRRMLALRALEVPYREIAAILNAEGLRPRRGRYWSRQAVHRIVARAAAL